MTTSQSSARPGNATLADAGGMLAFRTVQQSNHCARDDFLYELKAGPAGGRLRRPSSRRQRYDSHRPTLITGRALSGHRSQAAPPRQGRPTVVATRWRKRHP